MASERGSNAAQLAAGLPQVVTPAAGPKVYSHSPAMYPRADGPLPSREHAEDLLSRWFEAPVLLFSSGRAACHVIADELGLSLHRHRMTVPRFLSRCILNTVTMNAFPIQAAGGDAVLFYHQYGYRQTVAPREPLVIEDACHAFFSRPDSGARDWLGPAAIFSLPKFFSTHGLVGGAIIPDMDLHRRVRRRRDQSWPMDPGLAKWRRDVLVAANLADAPGEVSRLVESAFSLLLDFPGLDPQTLAGFPTELDALAAIGKIRLANLRRYRDGLGAQFPHFLFDGELGRLPYALPCFADGDGEALSRIAERLEAELNLHCGVYNLDVRRDMYSPDYRQCLLLPCHQQVPAEIIDAACALIRMR